MSETPDKPSPFTVERTPDGNALVARAQVKMVDDEALKTLTRHIDEASGAGGVQLVVLELSKVTILPSMALGLLVQIANKCKAREQRLKLAAMPPQVRQVFTITRLDRGFQFADTVDAALAQQ
jgi:anti-sigma B factor antagonist